MSDKEFSHKIGATLAQCITVEELIRGRSTMTSHILNKKQQFYKNKMRLMALKDIG